MHDSKLMGDIFFLKSCAQVETCVAHPVCHKSGGLKPKSRKNTSHTTGVRFKAGELEKIRTKAQKAGCSTNTFIRASALGSVYEPPLDPALVKALFTINKELTAQGRNLNQIARQLNSGTVTPSQAVDMVDYIRIPLIRALCAVKNALDQGAPHP